MLLTSNRQSDEYTDILKIKRSVDDFFLYYTVPSSFCFPFFFGFVRISAILPCYTYDCSSSISALFLSRLLVFVLFSSILWFRCSCSLLLLLWLTFKQNVVCCSILTSLKNPVTKIGMHSRIAVSIAEVTETKTSKNKEIKTIIYLLRSIQANTVRHFRYTFIKHDSIVLCILFKFVINRSQHKCTIVRCTWIIIIIIIRNEFSLHFRFH